MSHVRMAMSADVPVRRTVGRDVAEGGDEA